MDSLEADPSDEANREAQVTPPSPTSSGRCPVCNGRLEIQGAFATPEGEPVHKVVCPRCHGTGKVGASSEGKRRD
jgi:cytochrome c5